jgi:hypothetical protein
MTDHRFTHDPRDSRGIPGGAPTSFDEAQAAVDEGDADGLGFVLTRHDPFLVVEVANGRASEELPANLEAILSALGITAAEAGEGDLLRLFYKGAPDGVGTDEPVIITVAGDARNYVFRVFASGWTPVTGRHIAGTPQELRPINEDALWTLLKKARDITGASSDGGDPEDTDE